MNPDNGLVGLFELGSLDLVWQGLKWVYVLAFSVYAAFAVIVLAQVRQMIAAFRGQLDATLMLIAWIHLLVAVGATLVAIVIL